MFASVPGLLRLRSTVVALGLALALHVYAGEVPPPPAAVPAPVAAESSVAALIQQSRALASNEPARAISLARTALELAQRNGVRLDELRARAQLSEALRLASSYPEAREVAESGLALPAGPSPEETLARAQLVYAIGQIDWNRGDYPLAETRYLEAQHTAEALGDQRLLMRALNSRGIVARHQKLFQQSEQHFRAALELAEKAGDAELRLQVRNNLAILLYDQHRFEEARPLLLENLRVHTAANNRRSMANALINLGSLESTAANPGAALPYYEQALALRLELGVPRHVANARISLATTLARLGRAEEALAQLRAARPLVEQIGSRQVMGNLLTAFSEASAANGDYRAALDYQRQANVEEETVASEKTATAIAEMRERFEADKRERQLAELRGTQQLKDAELARQEAELQRGRVGRYALAGLLLFGTVTALAIISRQRAIARSERRVLEETRRARDVAEEAHDLKSKLLDLAAHDLKAPLVGVMLTADTIADDASDRPEVAERARAVRAESQRMFDLVQDLLESSAAESGRLDLTRAPLDLAALAHEVVATWQERAGRKNQRIECRLLPAGAEVHVDGDAARLRQVLENLLSNALKFSPPGTTVQVTVRRTPEGAGRVEVRDEGPGLTAEDQAALFRPFHRLSAVPTGGESSTGLGLALTRDLVVAHGGRIAVESTPGAGATFSVELPGRGPA